MGTGLMRVLGWPAYVNRAANPYNWLLYTRMGQRHPHVYVQEFSPARLMRERWDIWHLHWPEHFLNVTSSSAVAAGKLAGLLSLLAAARVKGVRIVWTAHNLASHERKHPVLEAVLRGALSRVVSGTIVPSQAGVGLVRDQFSQLSHRPMAVIPLGHYRDVYPSTVSRERARQILGLAQESHVLGFVGAIRPYKNVPHLIRTFRTMRHNIGANAQLLIAGKPNSAHLKQQILEESALDECVQAHTRFIGDDELSIFLSATDSIILPFQDVLNSASAVLALSFDRPVVAPHKGGLIDLAADFGPPYVQTYEGSLTTGVLERAVRAPRIPSEDWAVVRERLEQAYSWDLIADQTLEFYERVLFPRWMHPAHG